MTKALTLREKAERRAQRQERFINTLWPAALYVSGIVTGQIITLLIWF
jgi:hypothetical protein